MTELICVENGDVLETACDVLVLKYAQSLFGADRMVAKALGLNERKIQLLPGEHKLVAANDKLACRWVLFMGVPHLRHFGYAAIRNFAKDAMAILDDVDFSLSSVAMTMHGMGYGLDEREAFSAQVAGLLEYKDEGKHEHPFRPVHFIEKSTNRSLRMRELLGQILATYDQSRQRLRSRKAPSPRLPDAGIGSDAKRHLFVAMPFNDEMEDVYEFGIKQPVNNAGCLCERCDRDIFMGDILDRIKTRIAGADAVIADLTGSNPNVYLEVGYAWGKDVQTLLIAHEGEELKFDVQSHKCIFYKNISHLRKQLTLFMEGLELDAKGKK